MASRFVGNIFGELFEHAKPKKLDACEDHQKKDRQRYRHLHGMHATTVARDRKCFNFFWMVAHKTIPLTP